MKDLFKGCLFVTAWMMNASLSWAQVSDAALNDAPTGVLRMDQASSAPIVIGHRGASGYLPEHSTESAVMAHVMECDYIEQDCVISRDGVPIVMHDITLDDLTDVAKVFPDRKQTDGHWYVFDFTVEELRRLRLTERRSPGRAWKDKGTRFPLEQGSFRISTLAEHLQLIQGLNQSRGRTAGVYVEVKEPAKHRAAGLDASTQILKVLAEYGYDSADDAIFLQCFEKDEVIRIRRELKCPLPLIYLLGKAPAADDIKEAAGFCDGLGVLLTLVVSGVDGEKPTITELVETAHEHGLQVHVWTFRTDALPAFAKSGDQLLEWLAVGAGVDGIFSDQPDVVVKWRSQRVSQVTQGNPFRLLNDRPQK
jgi:glycerophosphoryl diester phosphodiesterase